MQAVANPWGSPDSPFTQQVTHLSRSERLSERKGRVTGNVAQI